MARDPAARLRHRRRNLGRVLPGGTCRTRALSRITLGGSRAAQRISLPTNSIRALLGGAHGQPSLDLDTARSLGGGLDLLALTR